MARLLVDTLVLSLLKTLVALMVADERRQRTS